MGIDELKIWLLDRYRLGRGSLRTAIRNSKIIQNALIHNTRFLPEYTKFSIRAFHIIMGLDHRPQCQCGKYLNFNNNTWIYSKSCSTKCAANLEETKTKRKSTCLKKYNTDNYAKTDEFKRLKLGRFLLSDEVKENNRKRMKDPKIQEELRNAVIKKFGSHFSKTDEFKNKIKNTCLNKYGVDHHMKCEQIKNKVSAAIKLKYNEEWYVLVDKFKENFGYKLHECILPSGKKVKLQGYEKYGLSILLEHFDESDIHIRDGDIRSQIGKIEYIHEDKTHRYFPDFYIKSINTIIEVKSKWTMQKDYIKNIKKKQRCLDLGINFQFWIFDKDSIIEIIT